MEEKEIYIEKPFNWKKFFKITGIVVAAIAVVLVLLFGVHRLEGYLRGGKITKYENWKSATVEKTARYCDINLDEVNKIRIDFYEPKKYEIGYLTNNPDYNSVFYMIYDEEEIEKLISQLRDVRMYGIWEDSYEYYEESSLDWKISLYVDDKEYVLTLSGGYIEGYEDVEELKVDVKHKDFPLTKDEYPDPAYVLWSNSTLIYNQNLNEYVYDLYERCIKDITVENILSIYDEGNPELFFAYENNGGKGRSYEEKVADGLHILRYTLQIADFDGYIVVDKQNESKGEEVFTDILGVKIYNNAGEYIDYLNSDRAEVEAFLK